MEIEAFDTVDFKASRELREALNPGSTTPAKRKKTKPTRSAKASKKRTTKRRTTKRTAANGTSPRGAVVGRRRMTPRDEEAELDAMIADDELFGGSGPVRQGRLVAGGSAAAGRGRSRAHHAIEVAAQRAVTWHPANRGGDSARSEPSPTSG